ncbi:DUF1549 domain-containing protein [Planctomicrobium sp. SH661]|uniref:DUF1549 domain-containing protein n=1 Tax=Planctomicrobium sp. SH661 TaxID=3448124 RepID=UPI003F5B1193
MRQPGKSRLCRSESTFLTITCVALTLGVMPILAPKPLVAAEADEKKVKEPSQAQLDIEKYQKRIAAGEADQVIKECTDAITAAPTASFTAYAARGLALNAKKDFDAALKDFDEAIKAPGREDSNVYLRTMGYTFRSDSFFEKGQFIKAVDNAYFAMQEDRENAQAYVRRAKGYVGWQKEDKAIRFANEALSLDPKLADAISVRGLAYGLKGDFKKCVDDQTEALKLNANSSVFLERRAMGYLGAKDFQKAAADVTEAIKQDPNNADAYCVRAMMQGISGNIDAAISDLETALRKNPASVRAHYQMAMAFKHQKQTDDALTSINSALRLNEIFVPALLLRAELYSDKKDFEKSVEDYTAAIAVDPNSIPALTGRAQAYRRLNKTELAKLDTAKLKELQPAKKSDSKEKEKELAFFKVSSKQVDPKRRQEAIEASKKIDEFVAKNYEKYNVKPNEMTTDAEFVRRIYLDITGTIPTYQQTVKFLSGKEPDKRAALIDELLASEGYASHSFNYWADVLRYIDGISQDVDGRPYRQWIKQSLAENKPWDKMVQEMVTAEGFIWTNPATGYMHRDADMPLDNMNNTVRIFLGTRIGCAQCHNHPFDRWTQKEFYQMAAFTYGVSPRVGGNDKRYWEKNPRDRLQEQYDAIVQEEEDRRNGSYEFDRMMAVNMRTVNNQVDRKIKLPKTYAYDDAKPEQVVEPETLFGSKAQIREGETPREAFARWLTEKENPRFAKTIANRLWQRTFGIGQIEPVDDMTDHTVAENPELMDFLEQRMKDLNYDMKEYLRMLYNSQTYQRQACFEEVPFGAPYHFPGPALRRMTAEQVWDSFLTLALVDPNEYHEVDAKLRMEVTAFDLTEVTAQGMMDSRHRRNELNQRLNQWEEKYRYKGVLLARASELPSPLPPNHFIRMFGQSDRELISSSSTNGSVPQVLFMFNGPITHMLLEKNSTIYNNVMKKKTVTEGVKVVFLTVLNREPDADDLALASREIRANGPPGYGNVIWSLVNTREFLFVQ